MSSRFPLGGEEMQMKKKNATKWTERGLSIGEKSSLHSLPRPGFAQGRLWLDSRGGCLYVNCGYARTFSDVTGVPRIWRTFS